MLRLIEANPISGLLFIHASLDGPLRDTPVRRAANETLIDQTPQETDCLFP